MLSDQGSRKGDACLIFCPHTVFLNFNSETAINPTRGKIQEVLQLPLFFLSTRLMAVKRYTCDLYCHKLSVNTAHTTKLIPQSNWQPPPQLL